MATTTTIFFGIFPRFYILCYINNEKSYKFVELLREKLSTQSLQIQGIQFLELIPFTFKTYDTLGAVEIRLQELNLDYMQQPNLNQTKDLFNFSQAIEKAIQEINLNSEEEVFLDMYNPPYFISIANSTSEGEIDWTKDNINKHKKSLSKWVEFYSGQFDDYSDELYDSRTQNNLSNRTSELHFIRLNSAFIYMAKDSWLNLYGDYMEKFFILQILKTKALLFSYYILNLEIDKSNMFIQSIKQPSLKQLENELESLNNKKILIDNLNDELIRDQIMNRRAHSKKTLDTSLQLFGINFVRNETNNKFQRLKDGLTNERAVQQQKFANSQKRWLLILNVLLGSSVIFSIVDRLKNELTTPTSFLFSVIGSDLADFIISIADPFIWVFLVLIGFIGAVGIIYNLLSKKIGFSILMKKFSRNK